MSFRVELTEGAYADLDRLMDWLAQRSSPAAADRLTARFYEALPRLVSNLFSCGVAYENRHLPEEVRHLLFKVWKGKPYRAWFIVRGEVVIILGVRAPGEKPARPEDIQT